VLKQMKRPAAAENNLQRVQAWRAQCPDLTIRSTFIVGFPGETDNDFEELLAFLEEAELDRVGCFEYSPVAGAAANELPGSVADEVKRERWERLMALQSNISRDKLAAKVGQNMTVLVDGIDGDVAHARSSADAPEIDGLVFVEGGSNLQVGEFAQVQITHSEEYDLVAVPATN